MKRSMKKIALPVTRDNRIDDHFGHCEMYSIYTINEQNGIAAVDTITSAGGVDANQTSPECWPRRV